MIFRIVVTLLAVAYVVWKVWAKWDEFPALFARPWTALHWSCLTVSTLLMVLNYGLEAQKWRLMVRPFYPVLSLWTATIAVFAGMAAGIFTPNRIGEYAGRVLFLKEGSRVEAIMATFVDRICQLLVTLLAGLLALAALFFLIDPELFRQILEDPISEGIFIFLSIVLGVVSLGLLIVPKRFAALIPDRWNRVAWIRKAKFGLQNLKFKLVGKVLALAALRYFVFSSQYVLLMYAFDYQGDIAVAYVMIALIFLGKSVLPVMGIFELGVRESVALLVMTAFGVAETVALGSTLMLYLVNILLPTLLGVGAMQKVSAGERE